MSRFRRLGETGRAPIRLVIDGAEVSALAGDTLMVALLANTTALRDSEFDAGRRAGFCLMAACQDCWIWTEEGERLRACSTEAADGMRILTRGTAWRIHAS